MTLPFQHQMFIGVVLIASMDYSVVSSAKSTKDLNVWSNVHTLGVGIGFTLNVLITHQLLLLRRMTKKQRQVHHYHHHPQHMYVHNINVKNVIKMNMWQPLYPQQPWQTRQTTKLLRPN
jgi:hypothetical protein